MQTAIMRRSYSVNSCNKTCKTNRKNRETVCSTMVCVCMCVCMCGLMVVLYVCVYVSLNICFCVHDTFTAVSTIEIKFIYKDIFVVVD